jgi:hypothetical protein
VSYHAFTLWKANPDIKITKSLLDSQCDGKSNHTNKTFADIEDFVNKT